MAFLVPSLKAVFAEVNAVWPNRDKRTDGWIGDKNHCPGSSDHCADSSGAVHAIDIDKDGIDPGLVIGRLINYEGVIRYINHSGYQYHVRNDFEPKRLTGDPHLGWIHVSIEHTNHARNYTAGYGISGPAPVGGVITIPGLPTTSEEVFDYSQHVVYLGTAFAATATSLNGYASAIAGVRV